MAGGGQTRDDALVRYDGAVAWDDDVDGKGRRKSDGQRRRRRRSFCYRS